MQIRSKYPTAAQLELLKPIAVPYVINAVQAYRHRDRITFHARWQGDIQATSDSRKIKHTKMHQACGEFEWGMPHFTGERMLAVRQRVAQTW